MRLRPIGLLLSGVVVASSACSVDTTAPSSLAAPESAVMARAPEASDRRERELDRSLAKTYTVTIDPQRRNVLRFGRHTLDIPARAVCSPKSGYGLETFDLACKGERAPITITAVVQSTADGTPRIDLLPELRFDPKQQVTLTLYVPTLTPASSDWNILYCATHSLSLCVDESQLDPTLATHADYQSHTLFRRIKHFSGYFVES